MVHGASALRVPRTGVTRPPGQRLKPRLEVLRRHETRLRGFPASTMLAANGWVTLCHNAY